MPALQRSAIVGQKSTNGTHGEHVTTQLGGPSISQRRNKKEKEQEKPQVDQKFLTTLASYIDSAWERNKRAKLEVEQRMLRNLRQRDRQYEADVFAAIQEQGGSQHYDGLTTTKCRAAESWIMDVLIPSGDRPWDIEHTPIPDVNPEIRQAFEQQAVEAVVQEAQTAQQVGGIQTDPHALTDIAGLIRDQMEKAYKEAAQEEADEKARNMANLIEDQLDEGGYYPAFQALIRDFVTFPACFLMGPIFRRKDRSQWKQVNGQWIPQVGKDIVQEYVWISPFDVYPEGDSTGVQDGDLFVRRRISRKDLTSLRGVPGYDTEAIDAVIDAYGKGGLKEWTTIDSPRNVAENRSTVTQYDSTKIEVLRFWGSVQGQWLIDHIESRNTGLNTGAIDPYEDYEIDAIKIGEYIIRAIVNPDKLGRKPISKACYEEVPGAFWGNGIPDLIEDEQKASNALARSIVNNSVMSSGPLTEINTSRTVDDGDPRIYPWMVIEATEDQMKSNAPAVRFTSIPNNTEQMLKVWDTILHRADENSGVPAYAHGDTAVGGAGNTASGLSMLMNSSSKLLRMAIYNLDFGVVQPTIERTYHHNMLFSKDDSIKGDLRVVPKGAAVMLIREQMAARQGEFADSTNNPLDYALMGEKGRKALRKSQARNLNLSADDLFPDEVPQTPQPGQAQPSGPSQPMNQPRTLGPAGQPVADYQKQTASPNAASSPGA